MNQKNEPSVILPVETARETLRARALSHAQTLARSVSRLTSADAQPCLEYGEEIAAQRSDMDALLFAQHCRCCLERCIAGGRSSLRYRFLDGSTACVRFQRLSLGRVRIRGLA